MNDFIRKTLYTSVGAAVLAQAKFKEFVEELIQNNELTKEEGQRVILATINTAEMKKEEVEANLLKLIDDLLVRFNLPLRHELEIKLHDIFTHVKQHKLAALFKKKLDSTPTTL